MSGIVGSGGKVCQVQKFHFQSLPALESVIGEFFLENSLNKFMCAIWHTVVGPNKGIIKVFENESNKGIFPLFAQFPYFKNFHEILAETSKFL